MATPIRRGRSYCYGVVQKEADVHNPKFRYKECAIAGDILLDSGVETWEEFFLTNPRGERRTMTHTVYEIELKEGKRTLKYVTEGMFAPPGAYRKNVPEPLGDAPEAMVLHENPPTPLAAYSTNSISLPEVNEIVQSTVAAQAEFVNEQMNLLRSIIEEKDRFIYMLQQSERQKIDTATAMYLTRIENLEAQTNGLIAENTRLNTHNALLQSQVEKLEWQAKEAKKIEERLQRDFEEATKVVNQGLADNNPSFFDKLLDRPLDEVIRGVALLKDLFVGASGTTPAAGAPAYTQEQLQELYEQAKRYGMIPGTGIPGVPASGFPAPPVHTQQAANTSAVRPPAPTSGGTPPYGTPPPMQPAATVPLTAGAPIGGASQPAPTTGTQTPPFARVETV